MSLVWLELGGVSRSGREGRTTTTQLSPTAGVRLETPASRGRACDHWSPGGAMGFKSLLVLVT